MKALLSALRSEAVMFDDTHIVSRITAAGVEEIQEESPFFPSDAEDWMLLHDVTDDQARSRLEEEAVAERVLTLFLPLFDSSLSRSCRVAIAGELEDALVSKPDSIRKARDRFHSAPFPVPQRLEEALSIAGEAEARMLGAFLRILSRRQPLIAEVADAWAQIPLNSFPTELDPEAARSVIIQAGAFTRLANNRAMGFPIGRFLNDAKAHPIIQTLPMVEVWLFKWTQPLHFKDQAFLMTQEALDAYTLELAEWKNSIMELAHTRPEGARQAALLLKNKQMEKGHARYAAMSLCDLAIRSKSEGLTRMQLVFAEVAVRANPHDPQCHDQFADALKQNQQLERALAVYDEVSVEYPDDSFAKCGKAEVLRDLNKPNEALACYEDTITKHPDDAVAKNGKAEVLRDLNRLPEALACYEDTLKAHPDNAVAKCGKAEVLRDLNKLDDALACYEDTLKTHPTAAVAKNGKAEVLRDLNKLDDALDCYEDTLKAHPDDIFAKNGKAEVLRDLDKLPEALACYEDTLKTHPADAVAKNGKAEVLRDLNRLEEALACYEDTLKSHPDNAIAKNGKANVLALLKRFDEALAELPSVPNTTQDWIGYHMRGMILLKLGRRKEASDIFDQGMRALLPRRIMQYFRSASAIRLLREGKGTEALKLLPEIGGGHLRCVVPLLRAHALGLAGDVSACRSTVNSLLRYRQPSLLAVATEVQDRFVNKTARHSTEWLFEREEELAMGA
jgi:tetratricopeptide (TPR) repeat protein